MALGTIVGIKFVLSFQLLVVFALVLDELKNRGRARTEHLQATLEIEAAFAFILFIAHVAMCMGVQSVALEMETKGGVETTVGRQGARDENRHNLSLIHI